MVRWLLAIGFVLNAFPFVLSADTPATDEETVIVAAVVKLGGKATVEQNLHETARVCAQFDMMTDATLTSLAKLPNVGSIETKDAQKVTEKGLATLKELPNLQKLVAPKLGGQKGVPVTIGELKNLEVLYLGESQCTDIAVASLKNAKYLKRLDLMNTAITDKALATIATLTKLTDLNISGTKITDKGINLLKDSTTLETVQAVRTNVTEAGARAVIEANSKLIIRR